MNSVRRLLLIVIAWFVTSTSAFGQSATFRSELLQLLPDDFAVAVVMNDLRGHAARWEKSDWLKQFRNSSVGKNMLETPELKQIEQWQADVQKHLGLNWKSLREDILGDTLVLSYTPGPKSKPEDERGLLLLHVRKPETLKDFIKQLNDAQMTSRELKSLKALQHKGETYWQRKEAAKTQYYFTKDSLFAFSATEDLLKNVIERHAAPPKTPWPARFVKAGAERALVTLCVNPRTLDAELAPSTKKSEPLPSYWRTLDGIFVTLSIQDSAEVRISVQAKQEKLPKWASPAFTNTIPVSSLWQSFPESSIITIASVTDFAGSVEALKLLMPEEERNKLTKDSGSIQNFLGLDPFKEVLPNIGPDWGVCMLPSKDDKHIPVAIFALAVKPGQSKKPVDEAILESVDFFAKAAVFQKPSAIRLKSVKQGKVEVKYLEMDEYPGLQPACALKEGFLLLATSPAAIADFHTRPAPKEEPKESMLVRISAPELAKLLQHRRNYVVDNLTRQQQMTRKEAERNLENVTSLLGLFEHLTFSQQGGDGQASWILRLTPAKK